MQEARHRGPLPRFRLLSIRSSCIGTRVARVRVLGTGPIGLVEMASLASIRGVPPWMTSSVPTCWCLILIQARGLKGVRQGDRSGAPRFPPPRRVCVLARDNRRKGLHLMLPIERDMRWDAAHELCKQLAEAFAERDRKHFTTSLAPSAWAGQRSSTICGIAGDEGGWRLFVARTAAVPERRAGDLARGGAWNSPRRLHDRQTAAGFASGNTHALERLNDGSCDPPKRMQHHDPSRRG